MSLGLAAPLALLLGALLALPLIAHLSRQQPRTRIAYGAMLLLERVVKRLRRRRRVKDPLLMLLRMLGLLLLALAATGPELRWPGGVPTHGGTGRVVVVLDRSLSMQQVTGGTTLLAMARERASSVVGALPDGTLVGLVVFGEQVERLTANLTADRGSVGAQIEGIAPSAGRSDLTGALAEARRLLGGEPGEVLVFTDEAGPGMTERARPELAKLLEAEAVVVPDVLHADPPRNIAVAKATYGDGPEGGELTLRVANFGPDPVEVPCEVQLPDGQQITVFVDLPPEGEAEARVTIPPEALGGVAEARCEDSDLPADDARYFHLPRVGASRVMVVDGDPGDTPTRSEVYFVERALAPWGTGRAGVSLDIVPPLGLRELDPEKHKVVVLANVADPGPFAASLLEFVQRGGTLVISSGENVSPERYAATLGALLPATPRMVRALAAPGELGPPLAVPSEEHPIFDTFRGVGRAGFGRIHVRRLVTVEPYEEGPEHRTLLSVEGGLPFLIERELGAGRVLWFTSTLDVGWTDFALVSVYMPTLQRLVGWAGGEAGLASARVEGFVEQALMVPLPELATDAVVTGPDGREVSSRLDGSNVRFVPLVPGAYQVASADAPPFAQVAVNVDPAESDVRRTGSIVAIEREIEPARFQQRAELTRPLIGLFLLLLAMAGLWSARRSA